MKKQLLFVMPSLDAGGAEKSLVNLLGVIDMERYDVDVVLFHNSGIFLNMLPESVKVIEIGGSYRIFSQALLKSVLLFAVQIQFRKAWSRMAFALGNKLIRNKAKAEQQTWKYASAAIKKLDKKYDAAIGFLEKSSIYFTVDKVLAEKKIGWIHTNYASSGMDAAFDAAYFKKLDHIVTVSGECALALENAFPDIKQKVAIIHNIISEKIIRKLAKTADANEMQAGKTNILSVGRLSAEKGFDLAVDACGILIQNGIDVCWFVIGDGKERQSLETQIKAKGLEGNFHLLGAKQNPYIYLEKASIYVQPSRYEGKSIAIDEAKIMGKPIVVTHYATVKDQILDGENGIVAEMNAESLAEAVMQMLSDAGLRKKLVANLALEVISSEDEIEKFYRLI